jgi:hypothetical protein
MSVSTYPHPADNSINGTTMLLEQHQRDDDAVPTAAGGTREGRDGVRGSG